MELSKLKQRLEILWQEVERLERESPGPGGTSNYNELSNKPSINGVELSGNKTSSQLGIITESDIIDAFTPSTITIEEGGTFPADTRNLLTEHKPIMINSTQYQFLSESGIDYVYAATPSSGAYPTITYFRIMKNNFSVEFHETAMDTVPTANSDNFITSGGVYTSQATQNTQLDWLTQNINAIRVMLNAVLYGFRINKNDSNPATRVEYLYDNANFAPAAMDFTEGEFDYGDWANAWFITGNKPVALKYDGTIDYYLDPNDYTKKADGTSSDIANTAYAGNFMATMPTVWIKRWEDSNYQYFAFSNKQVNSDFKAYAHDAGDGYINDMIYLPMFKGTVIDTYLRSIADQYPTVSNTATVDRTAAVQCGTGWDMWAFSAHTLITDLLTLISKSTNSQTAFGYGKARDTSETTHDGAIKTGANDLATGQFYGVNNGTSHVKVFHIEDFWGNRFERSVGLHLVDNKYMYKLTPPYTSSGSTSTYTLTNIDAPAGGYLTDCYTGEFGWLPKSVGGSTSTYFCDNFNVNASGTRTAIFGGFYETLGNSGSYFISLATASGTASATLGASPCYNPPHST